MFGIKLLHIQDGSEEMGDIISHSTGKHLPHTANFYHPATKDGLDNLLTQILFPTGFYYVKKPKRLVILYSN